LFLKKNRSDLEEVSKQIGLDGSISDIFEQFGAGSTGKISYKQFCEKSHILFGDQVYSSESSPEYCSTDSEAAQATVPMASSEKTRKKDDTKKGIHYLLLSIKLPVGVILISWN